MSVKSTIDFAPARDAIYEAGERLKMGMAQYLARRLEMNAPKDTGYMAATIEIVAAGRRVDFVSGSIATALDTGDKFDAVHVVVTAPYALFVNYGHFAGMTWVPPQPFVQLSISDTIGAFEEIAGIETILPFQGQTGWGEIQTADAGSAPRRGVMPKAGPKF